MATPLSRRRAGARNGARLAEAAISEECERQQRERDEQYAALKARRKAEREAEARREKLTAEDVKGSTFVRDSLGWHRVVRVSAKSVTVETPYSWTDRIPLGKILEAR